MPYTTGPKRGNKLDVCKCAGGAIIQKERLRTVRRRIPGLGNNFSLNPPTKKQLEDRYQNLAKLSRLVKKIALPAMLAAIPVTIGAHALGANDVRNAGLTVGVGAVSTAILLDVAYQYLTLKDIVPKQGTGKKQGAASGNKALTELPKKTGENAQVVPRENPKKNKRKARRKPMPTIRE